MPIHTKKPYALPDELTVDSARITGANGNINVNVDILNEYIEKHERRLRRYQYLSAMYKGFHDVYKDPEKAEWKPDNRLAVNFPRYIVDTFMGYGYGIPPRISHPDENINAAIQKFLDRNDFGDLFFEIGKRASQLGHAFAYLYQDENRNTRITLCSPTEMFIVYDDTMKHKALFAVRYGYHELENGVKGEKYGEILTRERIEPFDGNMKLSSETVLNPYGMIPCVEFRINDERLGLYECITGANELYNRTLGEKGNDVDAFAEAYLEILGVKVDEDGVRRIRDDRVINLFGTDDAKEIIVQFLQKPTADTTQENLLDRLEKLMFMTSMVANISDTDFGSASSGVSLAYKLWSTSNLALTFDRKARKSIRKCFKLWCALATNCPRPDAWEELDITFTRNIPHNIAEETQTAATAEGMISRRSQLELLSYIDDPEEELSRIEAEENAQSERRLETAERIYGLNRDDEQVE